MNKFIIVCQNKDKIFQKKNAEIKAVYKNIMRIKIKMTLVNSMMGNQFSMT